MKITLISLILFLIACSPPENQSEEKIIRGQQIQNLKSPNQKYLVKIPIENKELRFGRSETKRSLTPVWIVSILNSKGEVIYRDEESRMIGTFNVYWGWDQNNRLWLYNSDNGKVWKWTLKEDTWIKERGNLKNIPMKILPGYAREKK